MITKVFAKKLFGLRYEKIIRSIVLSIVLYFGIYNADLHIQVAPFVMGFMASAITIGEMWHALSSDENAANMKQLFMLPMESPSFVAAYVLCLGGYVFLTRTLPVYALVFAVSGINGFQIALVILFAIVTTLISAGAFAWKGWGRLAILWLAGLLAALFVCGNSGILLGVLAGSTVLLGLLLLRTDAYAFYHEESGKKNVIKGRESYSVWAYIFRYMTSHKNYLTNSLFFWIIACVLPTFFKTILTENAGMFVPMGFAILCMNTPICILLSSDPELEQAVRMLPGQNRTFFVPYCTFIFVCNLIANSIFLVSLQLQLGNVTVLLIVIAILFAALSAIGSVLLEYYVPIRGWKIENELWHHPRKYVVPAIMIILAGLIGGTLL